MPLEKDIPFIKGRRVGPDAIVSRDEQWAARSREANPPAKGWMISTAGIELNGFLRGDRELTTNLTLVPLVPSTGTLAAVAARIKIYTEHANQTLRTAIYKYVNNRDLGGRSLFKVRNSEAIFDLSAHTKGLPPLDVDLRGTATVLPGELYFIAYRSSSTTVRLPVIDGQDLACFPCYFESDYSSGTFPDQYKVSSLTKLYDTPIPWITYLSTDAKNLF